MERVQAALVFVELLRRLWLSMLEPSRETGSLVSHPLLVASLSCAVVVTKCFLV